MVMISQAIQLAEFERERDARTENGRQDVGVGISVRTESCPWLEQIDGSGALSTAVDRVVRRKLLNS
jgi:hypothetical protein